jgi:hypothetical protein
MKAPALCVICFVALGALGCGSGGDSAQAEREAARQAAEERRTAARHRALEARRAAAMRMRQAARRRAKLEAARRRIREARRQRSAKARRTETARKAESECDPNYSGACLDPYASDYDCEGGSGDGPEYTGPVTVVGEDHYGLDGDGDGYGCE